MPTYEEIYAHHADRYDELVRHEDRGNVLASTLKSLLPARSELAIELGCGTGRVTRIVAPLVSEVRAYDGSAQMIEFARRTIRDPRVTFGVADNRALPEADTVADVVVAGWTLGHVTGFFPDAWRDHARAALGEMRRVARPGATLVILETLGTATATPAPPNSRLTELYELFTAEHGFGRRTIDTSYEFPSVDDAARIMGFFFGPKMEQAVREAGSPVVPEWTAVFCLTA